MTKRKQLRRRPATAVDTSNKPHQRSQPIQQHPQPINTITHLQRTIGNRALGKLLIQRKMSVGPVNDKYEQEADSVAKQVVSTLSSPPVTQRQEDEEEIQTKSILNFQNPFASVQRQEDEEEIQTKRISSLQRQENKDEIQTNRDPMLDGGELSSDLESSVHSAKSGGKPLNNTIRRSFENAFDTNFSDVKIHTGSHANTLNRTLNARAFTTGRDVFFRDGEYNPTSKNGQELLAHELTHVVQQTGEQQTIGQPNALANRSQKSIKSPLQRMPTARIQRILDFKFTAKAGAIATILKDHDKLFYDLKNSYKKYKKTKKLNTKIKLLYQMDKFCHVWNKEYREKGKYIGSKKDKDILRLRPEIKKEMSKIYREKHENNEFEWLTYLGRGARHAYKENTDKPLDPSKPRPLTAEEKFEKEHKLTKSEIVAIKVFTGGDYRYMNPAMIGNQEWLDSAIKKLTSEKETTGEINEERDPDWKDKIKDGKKATQKQKKEITFEGKLHADVALMGLRKLPDWQGESFRGMGLSKTQFQSEYQKHKVKDLDTFASATEEKKVAHKFAERNAKKEDQVGFMWVIKTKYAKNIVDISGVQSEKEVLLLPKAKFEITEIEEPKQKGDIYIVHMEQIQ